MRLTPEPQFSALCAVYLWMNTADDLADSEALAETDRVAAAEAFWGRTERVLAAGESDPNDGRLWPALAWVCRNFDLPRDALRGVIDGQLADLTFDQPATEADLDAYCHRVASTVGRVCVAVWGGDPARTHRLADARGVALQRTNILRDVTEDAARGRVYLPTEALERHGMKPGDLARLPGDDATRIRLRHLLDEQVALARSWYARSAGLEAALPRPGRASSAAIGGVYAALLDSIATDPLAVFERRVRPARRARLAAVARAWASARLPAGALAPLPFPT